MFGPAACSSTGEVGWATLVEDVETVEPWRWWTERPVGRVAMDV